jgi:hypothetical protein
MPTGNDGGGRGCVADLLAEAPRKRPPVTLPYVRGLIRACGGQEDRIRCWKTAWRRLYLPSVSSGSGGAVIELPNRAAGDRAERPWPPAPTVRVGGHVTGARGLPTPARGPGARCGGRGFVLPPAGAQARGWVSGLVILVQVGGWPGWKPGHPLR